jgi:hypothetical protein
MQRFGKVGQASSLLFFGNYGIGYDFVRLKSIVFAPKGQNMKAQGNALGEERQAAGKP